MFDDSLHKSKTYQKNFEKNQKNFTASLINRSPHISKYGFIHYVPLLVEKRDDKEYFKFYETLMSIIRGIVLNYKNDKEVQKIISVSDKALELLDCCKNSCRDYEMGTLRADFLIDKNKNFKMNEINARFPFNGYFISYHINESLGLGDLKRDGIFELETIKEIPNSFERIFGNTLVIKDSEPDWDIKLYWEYANSKGKRFFKINPKSLKVKEKRFFGDKSLEAIVLELKQREILADFNKKCVIALQNYPHLNDLRSVLIAHDKRLLAVLFNKKLLKRYSGEEERKIIEPYLIETYALNNETDMKEKFIRDKDEWVLKHALKGKSKELYIGAELSKEEWAKTCEEAKNGPFVFQKKVEEYNFSVYFPHLKHFKLPLFGMLLGIDGKYISQGMYRGQAYDPTGLWDGHVSLPCAIKEK